ncbi:disulfide bond formation protein B [Rhodanobacter sp. C01]|uniref:disulfide bond formation protein B n=1 Tax=Rhodanobacter sp. C01 TaxID=1945856 RepID=UPI00098477DA|nr:disulfide bond formation protein B [Rhodanobacter sp. C01]OOG45725.1 disulfide bond formation protein B [Rhodanobacter sp. C01]
MNPFRWSYRVSFFAGFLICASLLGFALFAEYHWSMFPCPLCIFQRVAFIVMAFFFLLGALHAPRGGLRWVYAGGALLGSLFGIAVAGRHLWIQSLPADQIPSCGPPLDYLFSAFPFAKVLQLVFTGSGECAKVEPILGLPMPAWTLLWFIVLAVLAIVATRRQVQKK